MNTWMETINSSSSNRIVTPPAGEVWTLNSWSGFSLGGYVSFGTASTYPLGFTGEGTTGLDSFGSRTTLPIAFTNALPLVIRPSTTAYGVVTGFKFTDAEAPYKPIQVNATLNAGQRLSLQPPVGKVWRIIGGATSSPNLSDFCIDVSTNETPTWISTVAKALCLKGGKADLWSWRDKPLSIRAMSSGYTIYVYALEFNESDLISSRVYGLQTIAQSGTYDIRPPVGEEWIIDGIYLDSGVDITQMNGASAVNTLTSSYSDKALGPYRIDNSTYIRIKNTAVGQSATLVYLGRKT